MNSSYASVLGVALVVLSATIVDDARAQAQSLPEPGAAATPGTTGPDRSDPATATPGVVTPPADRQRLSSPDEHERPQSSQPRHEVHVGTTVQTSTGELLGRVESIVPGASGDAEYALVASSSGAKTAIPYSRVLALLQDDYIVLSRSRLRGSPPVRADEVGDRANTVWRERANQYWSASAPARAHSSHPEFSDSRPGPFCSNSED